MTSGVRDASLPRSRPRISATDLTKKENVQKQAKFKAIQLVNKKTGQRKKYKLYNEEDLEFFKATTSVPETAEDGSIKLI